MTKRDPAPIGWFLDPHAWNLLLKVKGRLYDNAGIIGAVESRDLANVLEGAVFNAIALSEDDVTDKS